MCKRSPRCSWEAPPHRPRGQHHVPPLLPPIRLLPLFTSADGREVTLSDYDAAAALETLSPEQKDRRIGEGAVGRLDG